MTHGRSVALDALRCIAVLMVMSWHMTPECPPEELGQLVCRVVERARWPGWAGVDLFFVLSGFLVSGLLFREFQREGTISLGRFLLRRGLKIYPAFYTLLVIYGILEWKFGRVSDPRRFLLEAFFVQNYFGGVWNHTWSLAVEEHFYFGIGLLLVWLSARGNLRPVVPLTFVTMAACLCMRSVTQAYGGPTMFPTHLRLDSLMFGTFLAYLHVFHARALELFLRKHGRRLAVVCGVALTHLFFVPERSNYMHTFGFTVNLLAFGGVLLVSFHNEAWFARQRLFRGMARVGMDSYSLYLWHMFAKRCVSYVRKTWFDLPYLLEAALFTGLTIVVGIAMARLVEKPALAWRDRILPSNVSTKSIAAQA